MKTTSSTWKKRVMILAALLVPAATWWASLRYHKATQQTETLSDESSRDQTSKEKRDLFMKKIMDGDTIEATEVRVLSSWNYPTDPDSVWHDQRREANQTLMQHGLPTLDGRAAIPDSPALPQRFRPESQK